MAQPSSLEVLARNACVQLLLYEGTRESALSLLETECFKSVSEGLLNRIVRYSPKVLTDRMLSALISSFVKELNLSKCDNVSLIGLARALKRSPHVRQLLLKRCSQLMCPDIFVYLGLIQLPVTHLSLENTTYIQDASVHVLICQLPHLTTLDLSNNSQLTDNVFLLDVDDQTEKEMSTCSKTTSFTYKYSLTSVDISACRGLSMLSVLHLSSLCGPRLKHVNFSWTKINCEALLFLAGYNLIDTTLLLVEELLEHDENAREMSLFHAVQCMMEPLKSLVHHTASNFDTKSEEAAAERSFKTRVESGLAEHCDSNVQDGEHSSETDTVEESENTSQSTKVNLAQERENTSQSTNVNLAQERENTSQSTKVNLAQERENTSQSTKVNLAQGSENSFERDILEMAQERENSSESDTKVGLSEESVKFSKMDKVDMVEESEVVVKVTDSLKTVCEGEDTGIDTTLGELRNSHGAIYSDAEINRTRTEEELIIDEDSCDKDVIEDIGLSEIVCEIDENKNSETKILHEEAIYNRVEEFPVSQIDSVGSVNHQGLDDISEDEAMSKLDISDTACEQPLGTYTDSGLNTADSGGSDNTGATVGINKNDTTKSDSKGETVMTTRNSVVNGEIKALLEEWNVVSTLGENRQPSLMFECSLVGLEITSITFRDTIIGAFCLENFFKVDKKIQKFGITWKGLSGDLMQRLVPSLSELRDVDLVDCTMLGTEGVRALAKGCVKLNKINLKGVDFFGDFAIGPALSISNISSLSLAGSEISDASLLLIADKQTKSLTELDLSWCEETITEKGINAICENCTQLRVLNMPKCPISDITLLLLSESCRQMTDLSFQCVDDFQTEDTFSMSSLTTLAQHLTNLRRLDISWNLSVKDDGVCAVLSYCVQLEKAIMSGIKTITVAPFLPIISGHTRDERKEKVDEETAELLYNSALSRSAVYAPNLRKLLLEYCDLVDEHQLKIVVDACRGTLVATDYYGSVMY